LENFLDHCILDHFLNPFCFQLILKKINKNQFTK
jgi:hypothetical protein